jgi:hypothetical protein
VTSYGDSTRARSEMIQFRRVAVRAVPAGRIAEHPAARTGVASL